MWCLLLDNFINIFNTLDFFKEFIYIQFPDFYLSLKYVMVKCWLFLLCDSLIHDLTFGIPVAWSKESS